MSLVNRLNKYQPCKECLTRLDTYLLNDDGICSDCVFIEEKKVLTFISASPIDTPTSKEKEFAKTLVFEYFSYLGGRYTDDPITYRDTKKFLDAKKHADIVCEYMKIADRNPEMEYFYKDVQKEIIKL